MIDTFSKKYSWLSNFYRCNVYLDGVEYASVEHAYQAAKTTNHYHREVIRNTQSAGEAKRYANSLKKRDNWHKMKLNVMYALLSQKFNEPYFKQKLLGTGDRPIIEGNHWDDTFWGVCNGVGENHLGKHIMRIRKVIRKHDKLLHTKTTYTE